MAQDLVELFESMEEHFLERSAIMIESGVPGAIEKAEEDRHRCEVKMVMRLYFPEGERAADYFRLVEKKRGKIPADKLRADCRVEWKKKLEELKNEQA